MQSKALAPALIAAIAIACGSPQKVEDPEVQARPFDLRVATFNIEEAIKYGRSFESRYICIYKQSSLVNLCIFVVLVNSCFQGLLEQTIA